MDGNYTVVEKIGKVINYHEYADKAQAINKLKKLQKEGVEAKITSWEVVVKITVVDNRNTCDGKEIEIDGKTYVLKQK